MGQDSELQAWIGPLVESDLRAALLWKQYIESSQDSQSETALPDAKLDSAAFRDALDRGLNEEFELDDSNLRIKKTNSRNLRAQVVRVRAPNLYSFRNILD